MRSLKVTLADWGVGGGGAERLGDPEYIFLVTCYPSKIGVKVSKLWKLYHVSRR